MTIAIVITIILGVLALASGVGYIIRIPTRRWYDTSWFGIGFWTLGILWFIMFFGIMINSFALSDSVVSGIVYNTKNNSALTGNTKFSVRASEDTYVSEENRSSYCLPPNSPYKELVNKAAQDKSIKVVVNTHKYFRFVAPWTCVDNVEVRQQ